MNYEAVFKRFFTDWQKFGLLGLGSFLVNFAAWTLVIIVGILFMGPALFSLGGLGLMDGPGALAGLIGAFLGFFVLALAIAIVGFGLSTAGLVGSVAAYRQGEPVSLGDFWRRAVQSFGKMVMLGLILTGIMLVSALILIIPVLGWLAWLIWAPMAYVTLFLYPAYLIVNQGYGVTDAVGVGFRVITQHTVVALVDGLIMLGAGIAFGMIGMIPLLGWILIAIFAQILVIYFFVERFEAELRPKLQV